MTNDKNNKKHPLPRIRVTPDGISIENFDEYMRSPHIREVVADGFCRVFATAKNPARDNPDKRAVA